MLEINFSAARLPGEILNFNLSMHEAKKRLTTGLLVASLNTMAAFLTSVNCGLYTQFCTDIHCSMNKVYTLQNYDMPLILFDTQAIKDKNTSVPPFCWFLLILRVFPFLMKVLASLKTSLYFVVSPKILYPSVNTLTL